MLLSSRGAQDRRGVSAVEAAVVYPVTFLLIVGTVVVGLGVFRYQELQSLARGGRIASVRGPDYVASGTGTSEATTSTVLAYVQSLAVGLNGLNCTAVTYSSSTIPCTVTVTLTYTWTPEGLFSAQTWTASSTMVVTY